MVSGPARTTRRTVRRRAAFLRPCRIELFLPGIAHRCVRANVGVEWFGFRAKKPTSPATPTVAPTAKRAPVAAFPAPRSTVARRRKLRRRARGERAEGRTARRPLGQKRRLWWPGHGIGRLLLDLEHDLTRARPIRRGGPRRYPQDVAAVVGRRSRRREAVPRHQEAVGHRTAVQLPHRRPVLLRERHRHVRERAREHAGGEPLEPRAQLGDGRHRDCDRPVAGEPPETDS